MDAVTAFSIIGAIGVAVVLVSLFVGDFLDGLLDFEHFDVGDGLLSTPVVGAFLAAFGAAGALFLRLLEFSVVGATLGALGSGVALGGIAFGLVRTLMHMPTDATPRSADLVGAFGTVVTRIPAGGLGEITVRHAGQRLKLSAQSDTALAAGTAVIVVQSVSPTLVVVTESDLA